jgi:hypothetical protein
LDYRILSMPVDITQTLRLKSESGQGSTIALSATHRKPVTLAGFGRAVPR